MIEDWDPIAEVTLAEWASVGEGWTHLPYLVRFSSERLPASWKSFLTGQFHAVLESGLTGNYTIAVPDAARMVSFTSDGRAIVQTRDGAYEEEHQAPLDYLRRWSGEVLAPRLPGWPPFQGGLMILLSYEAAAAFEPIRPAHSDNSSPIAAFLEAYEACIYDANRQELTIVVLLPTSVASAMWVRGRERAAVLVRSWKDAMAQDSPLRQESNPRPATPLAASFDEDGFHQAVKHCQEYISEGDTYQVNLSVRFEVPPFDALLAYEVLRKANPSPYMGFVKIAQTTLVCGSPELLVEVIAGRIISRPIAGTRPRGEDDAADSVWARELAQDTKERAEHLMLVDLLRNDVGRVARAGTVRVPEFMAVERYSHVMHLVSQVEGELAAGVCPADVIRALFPGGTITGAPKVRTMQIIAEIEPVARGFYTGSLGWVGASGDLCLNIIIRSLWAVDGRGFVQAGAGVVADSLPASEYAETLRKAHAPLLAAAYAALP